MSQKSRKKASLAVLSFLDRSVTLENLKIACSKVLSTREKRILKCRHAGKCFSRGTNDCGKSPAIRRKHLLNALKFPEEEGAHLRAYHISFVAKATLNEVKLLQESPEQYEIRHICGHYECDNEEHLKLGTVDKNEEDKHFHFLLDKSTDADKLMESFRLHVDPNLDVV